MKLFIVISCHESNGKIIRVKARHSYKNHLWQQNLQQPLNEIITTGFQFNEESQKFLWVTFEWVHVYLADIHSQLVATNHFVKRCISMPANTWVIILHQAYQETNLSLYFTFIRNEVHYCLLMQFNLLQNYRL